MSYRNSFIFPGSKNGGGFLIAELPTNSAEMKRLAELDAFLYTNDELKAAIEAIGWQQFIGDTEGL